MKNLKLTSEKICEKDLLSNAQNFAKNNAEEDAHCNWGVAFDTDGYLLIYD